MSSPPVLIQALRHRPQRIRCSLNDHFSFRAPVSVVFFYRQPIPSALMVRALQNVLSDFPLFAGVLRKEGDELYIDCNNQGAQVSIAQSDSALFPSLTSDLHKLDTAQFVDEIRPFKALKKSGPILLIKLSYYRDGMAIGYCWHHSIGDMGTFMEFVKALSAFAQGKTYSAPLIALDRQEFVQKYLEEKKIARKVGRPSKFKVLSPIDIFRFMKQMWGANESVLLYLSEEEVQAMRAALSEEAKRKLSRNDVLCAHVLDLVTRCRTDPHGTFQASLIANYRSRLGMPANALGNFVDFVSVEIDKPLSPALSAAKINSAVQNFLEDHFQHCETEDFVKRNGGLKKIGRILPEKVLPQYRNLMITNWSNFGVYSIDFGVEAPYLFLPIARSPIPWVSCIVEGCENRGSLITLLLPSKVARRLSTKQAISV